jgi:hypothetical protein
MQGAIALKPIMLPVMIVLALFSTITGRQQVVLLAEKVTEEGQELAGKLGDLDWTAVLREIKAIDGGKFKRVKIRIKDGDAEEEVEVDMDTRLKPGPVKSILDYINKKGR